MKTADRLAVPNRTLSELMAHAGLKDDGVRPPGDVNITSLTADSRNVELGSCFVAIQGVGGDGHEFVGQAVRDGAVAVVVDRDVDVPAPAVRISVEDSRAALAALAGAYYGLRGGAGCPPLVGVTGTNGKTTVTWLLRSVLREAGHNPAMLGTIEYDLVSASEPADLTTPGPMELCRHLATARDAGADFAVLEVSSHALDQCRTDGLQFAAAVFTNLSGDHWDYHGGPQAYLEAKRRLFEGLGEHAVAVVNADDPVGAAMVERTRARVISYGIDSLQADYQGRVLAEDSHGSRVGVCGPSFDLVIHSALPGRYSVLNVLATVATADALGISPIAIQYGIEGCTMIPGRLERVELRGCPFSVFVDYAHTDDALRNVLGTLRPLTKERLRCVFGCGGDRDRVKRPRMAAAVGSLADVAYVTSDNPRSEEPQKIIDEVLPGFENTSACRVVVEVDRRRAIETAIEDARPGDTLLIAGKGHEDYQLVGADVLHFDDAEVARACLEKAMTAGGRL